MAAAGNGNTDLMGDSTTAEDPTTIAESVVRAYETGFNDADADALAALYTGDVVFVNLGGELFVGRGAVRAQQSAGFDSALARLTVSLAVEEVRELGDRHLLVVTRQTVTTRSGEGPAPSGALFSLVLVDGADGWRVQACQNTPSAPSGIPAG